MKYKQKIIKFTENNRLFKNILKTQSFDHYEGLALVLFTPNIQIISFLLYNTNLNACGSGNIHIIYFQPSNKALILLHRLKNIAKRNKFVNIQLLAIPEPKLIKWYQDCGFKVVKQYFEDNGDTKCYQLEMDLKEYLTFC